jgi:hypothetical protein
LQLIIDEKWFSQSNWNVARQQSSFQLVKAIAGTKLEKFIAVETTMDVKNDNCL